MTNNEARALRDYDAGFVTGVTEANAEKGLLPTTRVVDGSPMWQSGYRAGRATIRNERHRGGTVWVVTGPEPHRVIGVRADDQQAMELAEADAGHKIDWRDVVGGWDGDTTARPARNPHWFPWRIRAFMLGGLPDDGAPHPVYVRVSFPDAEARAASRISQITVGATPLDGEDETEFMVEAIPGGAPVDDPDDWAVQS